MYPGQDLNQGPAECYSDTLPLFLYLSVLLRAIFFHTVVLIQHTHNTDIHAPAGFDPTSTASERPQAYAFERAATGVGNSQLVSCFGSLQESSDARSTSNRKFCLEYEFSLSCLQQSITGYCPQPAESSPNPHILIL